MHAQLSLDGIDPPVYTDSLFYALLPEAESARHMVDLAKRLRVDYRLKGTAIPSERLHVTLAFLGAFAGVPKAVVASAIVAGERLEAAPFDVSFDRVQKFGHDKRAVVLRGTEGGDSAVDEFQHRLLEAMRYQGVKPAGPTGFTAHLTLLYDEGAIAEERVGPIGWTAREFVLVHSLIGQSRYEILGRWPLRSRA